MSSDAAIPTCQSCGAEIPPNLLACPGCHRLLHAARLTSLAEEASAAQQAGDICRRSPPGGPHSNSCRRAQISLRSSERKSKTLDGNSIVQAIIAGRERFRGRSPAGNALAGLGFLGMLLWKLKLVCCLP